MKHSIFGWMLIFGIMLNFTLFGQNASPSEKIKVSGVTVIDGDALIVKLRWAPIDYPTWKAGNAHGYRVERTLIYRDGVELSQQEKRESYTVFDGPFKTIDESSWEYYAATNDVAAVAAGAIFSEDFQVNTIGGGGTDPLYQAVSVNSANENRYGFGLFAADQDFEVAALMGLAITNTVEYNKHEVYLYRVVMYPDPTDPNRPSGSVFIDVDKSYDPPTLLGLEIEPSYNSVMLSLPRGNLESYYTSFDIESKELPNGSWTKQNDKPLVFFSDNEESPFLKFTDSLESLTATYRYRMVGKTPFGTYSQPSNEVEAMSKPIPLGVFPDLGSLSETAANTVILNWAFPTSSQGEIEKFEIFRSKEADANFLKIGESSASESQFEDLTPDPIVNYYKVVAVDKGGLPNSSSIKLFQPKDIDPPSTPSGLSATVDSKGLVKIKWSANSDADLKGYRVFFSNNSTADFAQITGEVNAKTEITHQLDLNMLSKNVYYRVLATDFRENDSPLSNPVEVARPDILPPAKPLITKLEASTNGILIEWSNSSSADVQSHQIQRKKKSDKTWETVKTLPPGSTEKTYTDTSSMNGSVFMYRVIAKDQTGNVSGSSNLEVKPVKVTLDTIALLSAFSAVNGYQKQAKLTWEYPMSDNPVTEFQIYRGLNTGAPQLYTTMAVKTDDLDIDPISKRAIFIFRDEAVILGSKNTYKVMAKFYDGNTSPQSKTVQVQF